MTGQDTIERRPPRSAARRALLSTGGLPLADLWAERDRQYAKRFPHQALSAASISAVRTARILEAGSDPVARAIAARWTPPERMA